MFAVQTALIGLLTVGCVLLLHNVPFGANLSILATAILTWPLVQLLRGWTLWPLIGLKSGSSVCDISGDSIGPQLAFVARKSIWWMVPLLWIVVFPELSLSRILTLPIGRGWIAHTIGAAFLVLFFSTFVYHSISHGIPVRTLFAGMAKAFLAAGFPEDVLIIGFLGGSLYRFVGEVLPPVWTAIATVVIVDSLFSISHFPRIIKDRRFYAQAMTGQEKMSLGRSFIQMTIFSIPSWLLFFLTSSLWYPILMHTLADLSAFLPKGDRTSSQDPKHAT